MFAESHGPGFNTLLALKVAHVQIVFWREATES
jgi:hypothetical protein